MKKFSLLVAFLVFSFVSTTSFSQTKEDQATEVEQVIQDKTEIDLSDLPAAISEKLDESYADYSAEKAAKSSIDGNDTYYITMSNDDERIQVIFDAEGNVLEM